MSAIGGTGTEVIIVAFSSGLIAQLIKMLSYVTYYHKLNFRLLVQTGGMPSSHSSIMSALGTSVGLVSGYSSVEFAIALAVALVVMYDAAGVRQAAGKMAGILNRMTEDFYQHQPERIPDRLRELLGHTPFEVFVGALFGIGWAVILHDYFGKAVS
jgi:uncharacterized protein